IAVPEKDVLDLDGYFGLHPGLAALKPLWEAKTLAAIHAIGSPDATRSHFDAQDYMESGTPGMKATPDGWLNRYCQHDREHQDTPFRAVAFGPQLPRILAGTAPSLAIDDLQAFGLRAPQPAARDRLTRAFEELYAGSATGLLSTSSREAFDAVQMLKRLDPGRYRPANGADYPRGRLGKALLEIAQLIKADIGLQVAFADVTGWDTHVNQGATEGQLAGGSGTWAGPLTSACASPSSWGATSAPAICPRSSRDSLRTQSDSLAPSAGEPAHHAGIASSSAASNGSSSQESSCRTPLMKKVGVPLTPLVTPLRKSSRTRGAYAPLASSFRNRATSRPRSPAYSIRYSPSSANCRSNKRSCISQNLSCAPAASAASAARSAWG